MRGLAISFLAIALVACSDGASTLGPATLPGPVAATNNGVAPAPLDVSFVLGICGFPVLVEITGKEKLMAHPGGRLVITSPGSAATLTNLNTDRRVVEGITGTFRIAFLANGDAALAMTGRNLVETEDGLFLTIGAFTLTTDPFGNSVVPLAGTGRLIDMCAVLS